MKFKKKEVIFSDIFKARDFQCEYHSECETCGLCGKLDSYGDCIEFCKDKPKEAAELMGYEVIEDEEQIVKDDKQNESQDISKWTLEQAKEYCKNHVSKNIGCNNKCVLLDKNVCCGGFVRNWKIENIKQLTKEEIDICKALGAKWITKDSNSSGKLMFNYNNVIIFWEDRPNKHEDDIYYGDGAKTLGNLCSTLFQNVKPGDCICVEDLIKGE